MSNGRNSNLTLILDDENESLKSAHDTLAESGRENVIYASNLEEARSVLNGEDCTGPAKFGVAFLERYPINYRYL